MKLQEYITIEVLKPAQWEEYKKIRLEALQSDPLAFGATYGDEVKRPDEKWLADLEEERAKYYVIRVDGDVVGMASSHLHLGGNVSHLANLHRVFVKPEFRGRGLGYMLLQRIIDDLHTNVATVKVRLSVNAVNESAINLYKKLGFYEYGLAKKEMKIGDKYYDQVQMELIFKDKL